jgi:hypothetical protein
MPVPPQPPGAPDQPGGWHQQPGQPGQQPGGGYPQPQAGFPQTGDQHQQAAGFPHTGPQPQAPAAFGQPGVFPQQPGQPGGFGAQPGQSGAWAQQPSEPYGQPGPYGYPAGYGQFGQPGPSGQQGPFTPYPNQFGAPQRKKRALPWLLAGGGVLVVAAVAVLVLALAGRGDPQTTAQAVVDKLNAKDVNGLRALSCKAEQDKDTSVTARDMDVLKGAPAQYKSMKAQWSLREVKPRDESHADATVNLSFTNIPAEIPAVAKDRLAKGADATLTLVKESGDWKACDFKLATKN